MVGSLAVNPADATLWMATNTGLFRVPGEGEAPVRVTGRLTTPDGAGAISAQLVVRFTGPDELLGSGHPASDSGLPPALGLIRSDDAAKTWTSVSELGTADFHAIELSGDRLIGGAVRPSPGARERRRRRDVGVARGAPACWSTSRSIPDDAPAWIATTADGVYVSRDEGGTWRPIDPKPNSYLAWPAADTLYRLDPGGPLMLCRRRRRQLEAASDRPAASRRGSSPPTEQTLYALLLDGTVKRSADGGRSWTVYLAPPA